MSMSTSTEVIAHHWAFAIFLIVAIGLCCLMLVGGWFLGGPRTREVEKRAV
ncbi:NADH-quinone oxidoreductase subunit A [Escherichia coli]|uniref:NADH-quinone oxidoreductase subunit A n=1 Tax=Escherichia coli TaxID=562 RepID=A0A447XUG5_ECOLX|nr:NADH-quinone oxidoreductase subunit A [Escherichia coli]